VERRIRFWLVAVVIAGLGLVAAAGTAQAVPHRAKSKSTTTTTTAPKVSGSITVNAAASLTSAFTKMGADFQKANPGTTVTFNFGGSSTLVTQIQGGAPVDVFASADGANMQKVVNGGQVTAEPTAFATNLLAIVVKPGNPQGVKSLADLAKLNVVSLCAAPQPCGTYADQILAQAGVTIPPDHITRGADVKTTLSAVTTGDADAAIVYVTDAKAAGTTAATVAIPAWQNAFAIYPIAPVAKSSNAELADAWIKYTTSAAGQKTLQSFGFLPPPPSE
jgi:molybdate transport system substrate-binding protein